MSLEATLNKIARGNRGGKSLWWGQDLKRALGKGWDSVTGAASDASDALSDYKQRAVNWADNTGNSSRRYIQNDAVDDIKTVGQYAADTARDVSQGATNLKNRAVRGVDSVGHAARGAIGDAYDATGDAVVTAGRTVKNLPGAVASRAGEVYDDTAHVAGQAYDATADAATTAGRAIKAAPQVLASDARNAYGAVRGAAGMMADDAGKAVGGAAGMMANDVSNFGGRAADALYRNDPYLKQVGNTVGRAIKAAPQVLSSDARKAVNAVGDVGGRAIQAGIDGLNGAQAMAGGTPRPAARPPVTIRRSVPTSIQRTSAKAQ